MEHCRYDIYNPCENCGRCGRRSDDEDERDPDREYEEERDRAMATNNQAIEVLKDEYCMDCMWKEEDPTHCDCCMVGDILDLLKGLDDESDE